MKVSSLPTCFSGLLASLAGLADSRECLLELGAGIMGRVGRNVEISLIPLWRRGKAIASCWLKSWGRDWVTGHLEKQGEVKICS